jgi:hypothetical protein
MVEAVRVLKTPCKTRTDGDTRRLVKGPEDRLWRASGDPVAGRPGRRSGRVQGVGGCGFAPIWVVEMVVVPNQNGHKPCIAIARRSSESLGKYLIPELFRGRTSALQNLHPRFKSGRRLQFLLNDCDHFSRRPSSRWRRVVVSSLFSDLTRPQIPSEEDGEAGTNANRGPRREGSVLGPSTMCPAPAGIAAVGVTSDESALLGRLSTIVTWAGRYRSRAIAEESDPLAVSRRAAAMAGSSGSAAPQPPLALALASVAGGLARRPQSNTSHCCLAGLGNDAARSRFAKARCPVTRPDCKRACPQRIHGTQSAVATLHSAIDSVAEQVRQGSRAAFSASRSNTRPSRSGRGRGRGRRCVECRSPYG